MKRKEGMGRKDYRSIRNEARSKGNVRSSSPGVASSISDECPLIPTACLGHGQLGVLLGRARALSRVSDHLPAVSEDQDETSEDLDAASEDLDAVREHLD